MKKVYLLTLSLFILHSHSQNWMWDSLVNGSTAIKLAKDNNKNVYSFVLNDNVVKKYNSTGVFLWQINLPSVKLRSVVCGNDSSVYIAASFEKTIVIGGSNLVSKGDEDISIFKF